LFSSQLNQFANTKSTSKSTGRTTMAVLRALVLTALASSAGAARTKKSSVEVEEAVESAGVGSSAQNLWNRYVFAANAAAVRAGRGLQAGCQPQMHTHKGTYRGAALLFHGFTACPQQFENLIPQLTAKGFTVFAPVTPGHGYNYVTRSGEVDDYIADLPTDEEDYRVFGREMHEIMQAANGKKVIFGMSLGGGIAAWTSYLGGYDRTFLAAPMVLASGFMNNLISLNNQIPWRRNQVSSWGPSCETERQLGRAGICHFTAAIGAAARNLGEQHSQDAETGEHVAPGSMQIVFVERDLAVSSDEVINLALKYGIDDSSNMICGMDAEYGHSFLSPYDNPNEDKYWLDEATQMVANYLADGQALPQGGGHKMFGDTPYPRCNIKSTKSTQQGPWWSRLASARRS